MKLAGFHLPDKIHREGNPLLLQGSAVRKVVFFKPYLLAFYSAKSFMDATSVITSSESRCMRLIVNSDMITGTLLAKGLKDGLNRTHFGRDSALKATLDRLFLKFGNWPIHKGDVVDMSYTSKNGMRFYYNDNLQFEENSEGFAEAIFGIWFSDRFPDKTMRNALLGL